MISVLFKVTRMTDFHVTVDVRAGTRRTESETPLDLAGTLTFRTEEWEALRHLLPGSTLSTQENQNIKVEVE